MFIKKFKNLPASYFVSIGAGFNQIPLIETAKKMGFQVIGVDTNPCAPGFIMCDLKIQEAVDNYLDIYMKLSELLIDGEIKGIMTKSYGAAMKTASYLSEKFNIPFIPFSRSCDFINKKRMKEIFKKNRILSPAVLKIDHKSRLKKKWNIKFPVIKKPAVGHAKEGITIINNKDEMAASIKTKDTYEKFIFEEFIKGEEIIAIGIVHRKKFYLAEITDKVTTPFPHFVDILHAAPSKYFHMHEEIMIIGQNVADAFEVTTSPMVMEFIVSEKGKLYLIEAVPEFGGEFLSDILIPVRTGYHIIAEAVKGNTESGFKAPRMKRTKTSIVVKYITGKKGTLLSFNPQGPRQIGGVVFSRIFKEIGSAVSEPVNNLDRVGVIVASGNSMNEAIHRAEDAEKKFNIRYKEE